MDYVQKLKESQFSGRISHYASVEFWIIRYGMARSRPTAITDVKNFETEQLQPKNYTPGSS
jgi:hypothetical protein